MKQPLAILGTRSITYTIESKTTITIPVYTSGGVAYGPDAASLYSDKKTIINVHNILTDVKYDTVKISK